MSAVIFFLLSLALAVHGSKCPPAEAPSKEIICYYEGTTQLESLNLCNCTQLIFTNAVHYDGSNFTLSKDLRLNERTALDSKKNLSLIFTVTINKDQTNLLKSEEKKIALLNEISSFLRTSEFRGVEIDFHFGEDNVQKDDFLSFIKDLRNILDHHRVKRDGYKVTEDVKNDYTTGRYSTTKSSKKNSKKQKKSRVPRDDKNVDFYDEDDLSVVEEYLEDEPVLKRIKRRKEDEVEGGYVLMVRLSVVPEIIAKKYSLKALSKYADYFMVPTHMITDDSEKHVTFHPSRLMGLSDILNTDSVLDLLTGLGAPKSKIIISVPANVLQYQLKDAEKNTARSPTVGEPIVINQPKMCSLLKTGDWTVERDEDLTAPYAFSKTTWLAFEDEVSINIKAKYILLRELAGGAVFPIDSDTDSENCAHQPGGRIASALQYNFANLARKPRQVVLESLQEQIHDTAFFSQEAGVHLSEYRIVRVVDHEGAVHVIRKNTKTQFECSRQGYFSHPLGCNKFYRCVKFNQYSDDYTVFEYDCPAGLAFDERWEVCVWPGSLPHGAPCTGSSEIAPVPRSHYACPNVEGYYADPENCRWFFACLDHARDGVSPLTAYEFRCPFGLVFDENTLVCDWPWVVGGCGARGAVGLVVTKTGGVSTYEGAASFATIPDYVVSGGRIANKQAGVVLNQNIAGLGGPAGISAFVSSVTPSSILVDDGGASHRGSGYQASHVNPGVLVEDGGSRHRSNGLQAVHVTPQPQQVLFRVSTPSSILVDDGGFGHRSNGYQAAHVNPGVLVEDGGSRHRSNGLQAVHVTPQPQQVVFGVSTPSSILVDDGGSSHRSDGLQAVHVTPQPQLAFGVSTPSSIFVEDGGFGHRSHGYQTAHVNPGVLVEDGGSRHRSNGLQAVHVTPQPQQVLFGVSTPSSVLVEDGGFGHRSQGHQSVQVNPSAGVLVDNGGSSYGSNIVQVSTTAQPIGYESVRYGEKANGGYSYDRPTVAFELPSKNAYLPPIGDRPAVYAEQVVPVATLKPLPKPIIYQQPAVSLKQAFYQKEIVTPRPIIVQQQVYSASPRPVVYQQEIVTPRPVIYQQEISPVVYQQQVVTAKPVVYQQQYVTPKPVVYQQQYVTPKPVVYQQEIVQPVVTPRPVVYQQQYVTPKPVVYQQEIVQPVVTPRPVVYQQQYVTPKPVVYQQEIVQPVVTPKPVVYQQQYVTAKPVVYQQEIIQPVVTPKPVVYQQQYVTPKPVVYQQQYVTPKPVFYQQEIVQPVVAPKPVVYQQQYVTPKPVVYQQEIVQPVVTPKPVVYQQQYVTPKPVVYQQQYVTPKPVVYQQEIIQPVVTPKPVVYQQQYVTPKPVVYQQQYVTPKPVVYQQEIVQQQYVTPKPVVYQQQYVTPKPVVYQQEIVQPVVTPKPVVYQQQYVTPKPVVYQQQVITAKPVVYEQQYVTPKPVVYQQEIVQPVVTPKPVVYQQQYVTPKPVVYQQEIATPKPAVYIQQRPVVYSRRPPTTPKVALYQQVFNLPPPPPVTVRPVVSFRQEIVTPKPVVYQQEYVTPEPVVYQQEIATPKPVVYQQQYVTPKPVVYEQKYVTPKPVVYQQEIVTPKPVIYQQEYVQQKPIVYQQEVITAKPVVYKQKYVTPKPVYYQQEIVTPKPVVYQQEVVPVKPVVYKQKYVTPKPVVYQQEYITPKPVVYQQEIITPRPVVYKQKYATPKPVIYQQEIETPKPVVYQQEYISQQPQVYQQEIVTPKPVYYTQRQPSKKVQPVTYARPALYETFQETTPKTLVYDLPLQQDIIKIKPVYQKVVQTTPKPTFYETVTTKQLFQPIVVPQIVTTAKTVYAESYERVNPGVSILQKEVSYSGEEYLPPVTTTQTPKYTSRYEIPPPPPEYILDLPTSTLEPTKYTIRPRFRVTTEASREYLPPKRRNKSRGKTTIVSIGQVDKSEIDDQNLEGVLDKYSGKYGELSDVDKEKFVTKVIQGNQRGTIKIGKEPEVSTVGYEITSRSRGGSRKFSSTSTTTEAYEEKTSVSTSEPDTGDISLATLDLKNLKIKKNKKTVIVVSQVSDANPILIGKLAGQCSCQSNKIELKKNDDDDDGAYGANYDVEPATRPTPRSRSGKSRGRQPSGGSGYPDGDRRGGSRNSQPDDGNYGPGNDNNGESGNEQPNDSSYGDSPRNGNGRRGGSRNRQPDDGSYGDSPRNGDFGRGGSSDGQPDDGSTGDSPRNGNSRRGKSRNRQPDDGSYGDSPRNGNDRRGGSRNRQPDSGNYQNSPRSGSAGRVGSRNGQPDYESYSNIPINGNEGSSYAPSDEDTIVEIGGRPGNYQEDPDTILLSIPTSTTTLIPEVSPSILLPLARKPLTESTLPERATGRRIPSRSKARVPFTEKSSPLFSPITADEIVTSNEVADASKTRAGAAFDRYGPGGWRSADETLQGSVDCKRPGLFRHPKYCNKFYSCNYDPWKKRYTLSVFNCPVHLSYDSNIGACNWPSKGPACADDNLLV